MKKNSVCCLVVLMLVACETKDFSYRLGNEDLINLYLEKDKNDEKYYFDINLFNCLEHDDLHLLVPYRRDTTELKQFVILDPISNEIGVYSNGNYYYYRATEGTPKDILYDFESEVPHYAE